MLDDDVDRSGVQTVSSLTEFQSVIRIHVLEAENLIAKDNFMGGMIKGKSDPYVKVRLGGQKFRSRVIKEDLNPRWSEIYEVSIHPVSFHAYIKTVSSSPPYHWFLKELELMGKYNHTIFRTMYLYCIWSCIWAAIGANESR